MRVDNWWLEENHAAGAKACFSLPRVGSLGSQCEAMPLTADGLQLVHAAVVSMQEVCAVWKPLRVS
jgi:hypothetical protein